MRLNGWLESVASPARVIDFTDKGMVRVRFNELLSKLGPRGTGGQKQVYILVFPICRTVSLHQLCDLYAKLFGDGMHLTHCILG
jgi:hypothetical protein